MAELGVGSFCIGLSILKKKHKNIELYVGTDISSQALEVAEINLFRAQESIKEAQVKLLQMDRFSELKGEFDFIFSNPPYIKESQALSVHEQVHSFEPHVALYISDKNYQDWFKELFTQVKSVMKRNGVFLMEGHESNLVELEALASQDFARTKIIQDYSGRDRFLILGA